jgi:hypothetical protein
MSDCPQVIGVVGLEAIEVATLRLRSARRQIVALQHAMHGAALERVLFDFAGLLGDADHAVDRALGHLAFELADKRHLIGRQHADATLGPSLVHQALEPPVTKAAHPYPQRVRRDGQGLSLGAGPDA